MRNQLNNLFQTLSHRDVLITPNNRLAAYLQKEYGFFQQKRSCRAWETPQILSFSHYLLKQYDMQSVLTPFQSSALWEKNIQKTNISEKLFDTISGAKLVQKAFSLIIQYELTLPNEEQKEFHYFKQWVEQYQAICQKKGWLDPVMLIQQELPDSLPQRFYFLNFDEWPPAYERFAQKLSEKKVVVSKTHLQTKTAKVYQLGCLDFKTELEKAAQFAKKQLSKNKVPIGIIVPELTKHRKLVSHVFQKHFEETAFNISAPIALNQYPLIDHGILLLEIALMSEKLDLELLSIVIRSHAFLGGLSEKYVRAQLDSKMRFRLKPEWSLKDFLKFITQLNLECPIFITSLTQFMACLKEIDFENKKPIIEWIGLFEKIFTAFGWPVYEIQNTFEAQLVSKWYTLLETFLKLTPILGELSFQDSVFQIKKLGQEIQFLPESKNAPVQILGLLEATGLPFESAWVLSLNESHWPQKPDPNPFIPLELQQVHNLPRSSAMRELAMSQRFMKTLESCISNTLIYSYAKKNQDKTLFPSKLIAALPIFEGMVFEVQNTLNQSESEFSLAFFKDEMPHFSQIEHTTEATANVLSLQAACPFKAFSECRLNLRPLLAPHTFLNASERGQLLHACLGELPQHPTSEAIDTITEQTVEIFKKNQDKMHLKHYFQIEKKQLVQKLQNWYDFSDKNLKTKLMAKEQPMKATLEKVCFSLRLDRIDKLSEHETIIIDYKTGPCALKDWVGPRLNAPQLPLYGILTTPNPMAICFAEISSQEVKLKGLIGTETEAILGLKYCENWSEQLKVWKIQLSQLAYQYRVGQADVDPKIPGQTCRYCSLKRFCRVQ